MAMNWPRWIKREFSRAAHGVPDVYASPLHEPSYSTVVAVWAHYHAAAVQGGRFPEIALNAADSVAYNMARCVWLANELNEAVPTMAGWRLASARRRAFDRFNFTLVPLGRSAGLSVRASRSVHGDAAWNIVRAKWLEAQVGHLILSGASSAAEAPRTIGERAVSGNVAERAVAGAVGAEPAPVLDWENLTFGVEIECIRPSEISMAEFARRMTEAGAPCNAEMYNHHVRGAWKIVTDGSLSAGRQGGYGMEVVSPILRGRAGFEAIRIVSSVLIGENRARPVCKINKTCGLHVHVGLPRREHRLPQNILRLYHHYEAVIDGLMPPSRRGSANNYCRPTTFTERISGASTLESLRTAYGYDRYRKVNLESIWRHGTVEYRQHAGTIEGEKIVAWATLVLKLTAMANSGPALPEGPASLEGLLELVGADEEAKAFWSRRRELMASPSERIAA